MPNSIDNQKTHLAIRRAAVRRATGLAALAAGAAFSLAALGAALPAAAGAQDVRILRTPDAERLVIRTSDTPMIGVTTASESERADTLGLRIESVEPGSPAEKAGLKAGDRLQAVNGLNLRADRADAGQEDYAGVLNRRLQREVQRTKPGATITLRVLSGGATKELTVTPVKGSEFLKSELGGTAWRSASADRAVLGLTIASTGTPRDTLGVFVQSVTRDGPAEKAGIIEGDRIAAINGVSLRVAREDAEDRAVGASKTERLSREVEKLKAGDVAELTVVTAGRTRTVRVTTVKAGDLPGGEGNAFIFRRPDGAEGGFTFRRPDGTGAMELPFGGTFEFTPLDHDARIRIEQRLKEMQPRLESLRIPLERMQRSLGVRRVI